MEKPPILQFAEFFFNIGFTREESIIAINCLEKGVPMGISMEVALGMKTMQSIDEAIVKAKSCEPVECAQVSQE